MKTMGIDTSATAIGIAVTVTAPEGDVEDVDTFKPATTGPERLDEIYRAMAVSYQLHQPDVILFEGYAFGSRNSRAHLLGEVGGACRLAATHADIPYLDIPPKRIKKWFTGNGNVGKDRMVAEATLRMVPVDDDNQADALAAKWLLDEAIGQPTPLHGLREDIVAEVREQLPTPIRLRLLAEEGAG